MIRDQKIFRTGLRGAVFSLFLMVLLAPTGQAQVGLAPSISVQPSNQSVLVGGTASFQVVASSLTTMSGDGGGVL